MSRKDEVAGHGNEVAQRGLWRLMVKLPALRGRLQILYAHSREFDEIFEAYDAAASTVELYRREGSDLLREYEATCLEIEADIIRFVLEELDLPE